MARSGIFPGYRIKIHRKCRVVSKDVTAQLYKCDSLRKEFGAKELTRLINESVEEDIARLVNKGFLSP